jgi:hypothetical protein
MKKLRDVSVDARLLAIYLMTNEHFQMVGIYRLHLYFMSNDTTLTEEQSLIALNELIECQFCLYDFDEEVVWVIDMAVSQVADNPNQKQLRGVCNELNRLYFEEELPFVEEFLSMYSYRFNLPDDILDLSYQ